MKNELYKKELEYKSVELASFLFNALLQLKKNCGAPNKKVQQVINNTDNGSTGALNCNIKGKKVSKNQNNEKITAGETHDREFTRKT